MKALRKEFWMEIRKSKARFLSIFVIVALGVAFFSGIQASSPDMRSTGDTYYDDMELMDLKVVGTLGLTDDDVTALAALDGVESAEGAWASDVYCGEGENQKVLHVESLSETVNELVVSEGRLPEKSGEIFLDSYFTESLDYGLGDTVTLRESGDDELLLTDTYTVVGIGSSPLYISYNRGNTTLGTGEINGFAYVAPESFDQEVYTQIYLVVSGAEELTSYTDAYDDLIDEITERVEGIEDVRCQARYAEVVGDAQEEIDDAQKELDDGKAEAQEELDDAAQELADAEQELEDGWSEYEDGKSQLEDAKEELEDGKSQLEDAKKQISDGREELEDAQSELDDGKAQLEDAQAQVDEGTEELSANQAKLDESRETLEASQQEYEEGKAKLDAAKEQLEEKQAEIDSGKAQIAEGRSEIESTRSTLSSQRQQCEDGLAEVETGEAQLAEGEAELDAAKEQLETLTGQRDAAQAQYDALAEQEDADEEALAALKTQLEELESAVSSAQTQIDESETELESNRSALAETRSTLESSIAEIDSGLEQLEQKEAELDESEAELEAGQSELDEGLAALAEQEEQLADAKEQLAAGQNQLDAGQSELDTAKQQLESAQAEIDENQAKLDAGQDEIDENAEKLDDAEEEIAENEKKLADGEAEIAENEQKLADARQELEDGEKELEDGKQEYEDAKQDAEEEIAENQQKLDDAQAELDDIEEAEWVVSDRNDQPEYSDYGDNADRIRNIGKVFPVIFFLVAALISLTTMTRMVEEERTQIGTMKALGYSKQAIAMKYICYALLATAGGSVVGVLIGEKILPYIIITAYGIMYHNVSSGIVLDYETKYALIASAAAVVCTVGATVFACARALRETPASLMRPPAPKEGKRVLVERMTFLWKRLSFSWKSTLRNLFRYKKRLFMTVFGIAGSMGLMLVGYGVQDSISDIADKQYRDLQHYEAYVIEDEDAAQEERDELVAAIEANEKIDHCLPVQMTKLSAPRSNGASLSVYLFVPSDLETFPKDVTLQNRKTGEQYTLTDEGAAICEKTAQLLGLEVGDNITIEKDGKDYTVKVAIITENYMSHFVYMTPTVYEETFGEAPVYEDVLYTMKEEYADELESVGREILEYDAALSISYTSSLSAQLDRMLSTLDAVIIVLIVSAGMLAFVVLYNLNNINITERQRELATLKVLGFYDGEVSSYVFRENVLLTIVGVLCGAVFGIFLHRYIIITVEVDAVMFGRSIKPVSFLICGVLTCVFSFLVNLFMHFKLKKIDMVESLKSVE